VLRRLQQPIGKMSWLPVDKIQQDATSTKVVIYSYPFVHQVLLHDVLSLLCGHRAYRRAHHQDTEVPQKRALRNFVSVRGADGLLHIVRPQMLAQSPASLDERPADEADVPSFTGESLCSFCISQNPGFERCRCYTGCLSSGTRFVQMGAHECGLIGHFYPCQSVKATSTNLTLRRSGLVVNLENVVESFRQ
jgi:hypothetical protein